MNLNSKNILVNLHLIRVYLGMDDYIFIFEGAGVVGQLSKKK